LGVDFTGNESNVVVMARFSIGADLLMRLACEVGRTVVLAGDLSADAGLGPSLAFPLQSKGLLTDHEGNRMRPPHRETHLIQRIGWLRAAVLGANDGIISTASLVVGVAAGSASTREVLLAGVAALVAGAASMAAGEYVSVSSQADTEQADIPRERGELAQQPQSELEELTRIYVDRGVEPALARQVSEQMMARDALSTHIRDELGISEQIAARPVQAALTSAATFASGAALPLAAAILAPAARIALTVSGASLVGLAALGIIGAKAGGAKIVRPTIRVTFWGAFAMAATAIIGALVGHTV
jgi:vacuolar iron transporter family protein